MTERKPMSRRTFMKAALVGLAGLYVASNVPDWFLNEQYSGWFKEGLWDYADALVRANVPDKKLQLQVNPSVRAVPYDVTLSHISAPPENNHLTVSSPFGGAIYGGKNGLANLYEAAVPNEAIFRTAGFLQEHIKGEINPPNNSGFIGVTLAAMYPERVIARKAASMEREKMLANTDPNVIPVVTFNEEGAFTWSIPNSNGGNGYIVSISQTEPLTYVSNKTTDDGIIIGMTPRQWTQSTTNKPIVNALCTNSHLGIPLEHTCPTAWIAQTDTGHVGMAGSYANLTTFSYSPQVKSDKTMDVIQHNILTTPSPFTQLGQSISTNEAALLARMPEMGFNQWKLAYPEIASSTGPFGDTVVYNSSTGLFRFVNKDERFHAITSLGPDEIWATPGETFPTDGPNYYRGAEIFDTMWDPTLNGMMLVPEGNGYRPVAFITTDQNLRFSLFQAQEMVQTIGQQMGVPKGSAFVNWDRHGAGGLFLTA